MADPKLIKKMAHKYVTVKEATIRSIAKEFGIGATTLQGYFAKDLKEISPKLFEKVNKKKLANKEKAHHNFENTKKESLSHKLKKIFHKK